MSVDYVGWIYKEAESFFSTIKYQKKMFKIKKRNLKKSKQILVMLLRNTEVNFRWCFLLGNKSQVRMGRSWTADCILRHLCVCYVYTILCQTSEYWKCGKWIMAVLRTLLVNYLHLGVQFVWDNVCMCRVLLVKTKTKEGKCCWGVKVWVQQHIWAKESPRWQHSLKGELCCTHVLAYGISPISYLLIIVFIPKATKGKFCRRIIY